MEAASHGRDGSWSSFDSFARRSNFDLISKLPHSILIRILSLLPFTDVINTTTLSKRWRFLWKMVPNLVFSESACSRREKPLALISFINKALLLRGHTPINKFSVAGFSYSQEFQSAVDAWLRVATGKNVREINLGLLGSTIYKYTLPQHMYTSSSIVKMTLKHCSIKPSSVVSWPSLKNLSIDEDPDLDDNKIERILSGSSALESLELHQCWGVSRLNVTSPILKMLVINSCNVLQISAPKVESLSILGLRRSKKMSLNLPALLRATLNFELRDENCKNSNKVSGRLLMYLLKTLNRVEELTLGNWCIQVLSTLELQKVTAPICTCKRLTLTTMWTMWDNPGIVNLLRSSVSVETLVINITQPCQFVEILLQQKVSFKRLYKLNGELDHKKYWNSQEGALVSLLQRLKTVKIIDTIIDKFLDKWQIELLLDLLEVILKNARELEKMVICTERVENDRFMNNKEVAHRLLSFPRASPSAAILCYNMSN